MLAAKHLPWDTTCPTQVSLHRMTSRPHDSVHTVLAVKHATPLTKGAVGVCLHAYRNIRARPHDSVKTGEHYYYRITHHLSKRLTALRGH